MERQYPYKVFYTTSKIIMGRNALDVRQKAARMGLDVRSVVTADPNLLPEDSNDERDSKRRVEEGYFNS